MKKVLIAVAVMLAMVGFLGLPADAAYKAGTAPGSTLVVGGDGGSANQVDLAGDVVSSYTSAAGNDTQFKSTMGPAASATVLAVYGDTAGAVGASASSVPSGGVVSYTMAVTNYSNATDTIRIRVDSATVTGSAKDSITIKLNGLIVFQRGVETGTPLDASVAPGATINVTVAFEHDTGGALGLCQALVKTLPNNGVGGDTGGYLGLNGDTYAGEGNASVTFAVTVNEINVRMSVEYGNSGNIPTYNGPSFDTVPGNILQYIIRYDNDGNDSAVGYTVAVKIPANSVLADTGIDFSSPHTGAVLTSTITDSAGTVVAYTNPTAERIKWTFSTPVSPNNGDSAGVVDAISSDVDAGILKFKVYIK